MLFFHTLVDCVISEWCEWSLCTETCGAGLQTKERSIEKYPKNGGKSCDNQLTETKVCKLTDCFGTIQILMSALKVSKSQNKTVEL